MAKIPFSIDYRPQIESGEYKVETGDGRSVRIISWDKKVFGGSTEIVALVSTPEGNTETVQLYCPDGTLIVSSWNERFKLFIVTPEPELSEFEKAVDAIYESCGGKELQVKKKAAELLALAREELFANDTVLKEYAQASREQGKAEALKDLQENLANNDIYSVPEWLREVLLMAKENGKNEALKDLPRWKKASGKERFSERIIVLVGNNDLFCTNYAEEGEYYLPFHILEKLPKEDESHE